MVWLYIVQNWVWIFLIITILFKVALSLAFRGQSSSSGFITMIGYWILNCSLWFSDQSQTRQKVNNESMGKNELGGGGDEARVELAQIKQ